MLRSRILDDFKQREETWEKLHANDGSILDLLPAELNLILHVAAYKVISKQI